MSYLHPLKLQLEGKKTTDDERLWLLRMRDLSSMFDHRLGERWARESLGDLKSLGGGLMLCAFLIIGGGV